MRQIDDFYFNIISTRRMDGEGLLNILRNGSWKLSNGSLDVARGNKCCSLDKTRAMLCGSQVHAVAGELSNDQWHKRLRQMNKRGLDVLARRNVFRNSKVPG